MVNRGRGVIGYVRIVRGWLVGLAQETSRGCGGCTPSRL